jgi:hypothetical protein
VPVGGSQEPSLSLNLLLLVGVSQEPSFKVASLSRTPDNDLARVTEMAEPPAVCRVLIVAKRMV